jgi:hypothetical protein
MNPKALLDKARSVYAASDDCIGFASRMCGAEREGFLMRLIRKDGFTEVAVMSSVPVPLLQCGDVLLLIPAKEEVYKTHVAIYSHDDLLLSKWGLSEGLVLDTFAEHAVEYTPMYTAVLRRVTVEVSGGTK